ncbi:glycoside hydrolase family 15 protein [Streptomyces sp. NPDC048111]|uniref:glycoside hydrolase family 15 protein n=1 Tax=Streptomyces sp. NPDC048111 TaxID=3365500 RepID=UPI00371B4591
MRTRSVPASSDVPAPQVLREYALIADGERGALIGPHGDVAWLCAPRWESGAVFNALMGGPGQYAITPHGRYVWGGFYENGSLIWRSRWTTEDGIVECREALAFPADPHRVILLRRLHAVEGQARVTARLSPAADFGEARPHRPRRGDDGTWSARSGSLWWRWTGAPDARPVRQGLRADGLHAELTLHGGESHDLVLELSDRRLAERCDADTLWSATEDAWAQAVPSLDATLAPADARHAYTVLRGLTSESGGMVAAATTSLPERAEAGRNYDYRYVWIRDQCYAGHAVAATGPHRLFDDAVRFVAARLHQDGPRMAPAYTTAGDPVPDQRELRLPGYPGGGRRVGKWVNRQFQLDAFGEALLLFAAAHRYGRLDADGWRAAEIAARTVARRRHDKDAGVWELDDRHWTHSRLICAAGLRALADAAPAHRRSSDWRRLADTMLSEAAATSLHPSGRWQRSPCDPSLDAALLIPPLRGALAADDPRTTRTLRAYTTELTHDHYAYRFRHDQRPLAEAEGAFLLCGHLMALAEHQQGRQDEALRWFERNRAACGPPGLFSEEYDIGQRQLRGNLPQAFVHALMLETAATLAKPPVQAGRSARDG